LYSDAERGIALVFRDKGDGGVSAEAATETQSDAHRWHVSSELVGSPDDHNLLVRAHYCTRACPCHSRWRMAECCASTRASTHTLARARRSHHACMRECARKQTHAPTHAAAAAHWSELDPACLRAGERERGAPHGDGGARSGPAARGRPRLPVLSSLADVPNPVSTSPRKCRWCIGYARSVLPH
jgi:hypothetical protein